MHVIIIIIFTDTRWWSYSRI